MKTVASDAFLKVGIRKRKSLLDLRRSAVKGGVEARHLRQIGIEPHRHFDRREIVRLVQRRKRHQSLQLRQQFRRDPGRPGMMQAAVDDTVAEGAKPPATDLFSGPR
jgi:hypothetical protein